MRAYWDGKKLWSRSGLLIVSPDYFTQGLPTHIELDGELFLGRGKLANIAIICNILANIAIIFNILRIFYF